ncbi:MAG: trypsin-like peptidase domain-containing protein [Polyangiaceae bacterium]|nr:trypsin-like peptidase domain-containing protein [Polyangiaceae bacterium]
MGLDLKGNQVKRLGEALVDGFFSSSSFNKLAFETFGKPLGALTPSDQKNPDIALGLISWALENDQLDELLRGALEQRPKNKKIQLIAAELLASSTAEPTPAVATALAVRFEEIYHDQLGLHDVVNWRKRLDAAMRCLCRVDVKLNDETFRAAGTGFLVGPQRILTNAHVAVHLKGTTGRARFDLTGESVPIDVDIPQDSILTESAPESLDYAIVQLSQVPPAKGTQSRGYLTPKDTAPQPGFPLFILQYPGGDGLKVCAGTAGASTQPNRMVYTTSTLPGSSGSPVFTMAWDLVGLHSSKNDNLKMNQGIPMPLIIHQLAADGKVTLLG